MFYHKSIDPPIFSAFPFESVLKPDGDSEEESHEEQGPDRNENPNSQSVIHMIPPNVALDLKPRGHQHIFDVRQQSQINLQRHADHREKKEHHQVVPDKPQRIVEFSHKEKRNAKTDRIIPQEQCPSEEVGDRDGITAEGNEGRLRQSEDPFEGDLQIDETPVIGL